MRETLGFIGLGNMGQPIASNLIRAGYKLRVYNRTPGKAEPLVKQGAVLASRPAEVSERGGVVLTMLDERTNLAQQVMSELKRFFGDKLCATTIPRNIRLAEAPSHGRPALLYDPRSKGAESYIRLAKEIIAHHLPAAPAAEEMDKTA